MQTDDLRKFLDQLRAEGELEDVRGADPHLEIGTLTELMEEHHGPALLFDEIKGYAKGQRVVTNVVTTPKRLAIAFGMPFNEKRLEFIRTLKEKLKVLKPIGPQTVARGSVMENVQEGKDVNMLQFVAPFWHELDGGNYIGTGCMVLVRDPEDGWVNMGVYRIQVHDRNTVGIYIAPGRHGSIICQKYWQQKKAAPIAVVLGAHPLLFIPAARAVPWGTSEYDVAGGFLGRPVEVIEGKYTGLPLPANAELVIEGESPPPAEVVHEEGPFGEATGYYASGRQQIPIIRVKRVLYRSNPVNFGAPPLKPPASGSISRDLSGANLWLELERQGIPEIKGATIMSSGYIAVVSIRQRYGGHARQVAMAAMSGPQGVWNCRFGVVVVDEDIDPTNEGDVLWAIATRCDPVDAIHIIPETLGNWLDPIIPPEKRAKADITKSRAMIIACRPYAWIKEFAPVVGASTELREKTLSKWGHLFGSSQASDKAIPRKRKTA
jgi:UbiD family decarboxylase